MELQLLQRATRAGQSGQRVFARAKERDSPQIGVVLGDQLESLMDPVGVEGRQVIIMDRRKREEGEGGFRAQQRARDGVDFGETREA